MGQQICIIITAVKKPTIKMNCPEENIVYTSVFGKIMPIV
jgi:hypothetical protein